MTQSYKADVVIVGGGLAGLYTALNINLDKSIIIISKDDFKDVSSRLAQGGIAAVMDQKEDDLLSHIEDSIIAGAYLSKKDALETLVFEAKENIDTLIDLGVSFDRDDKGNILLAREGGHRHRRILRSGGDATGKELMMKLQAQVTSRDNITILGDFMAIDIIEKDNKAYGVTAIDKKNNFYNIHSSKTIIATGGVGSVFSASTNALEATGDGIAMALRKGVHVSNMEFIQFHPTALHNPKNTNRQRFLISEAVRGEGAILRNVDGVRFMEKYHKLKELAPRDIVSQSIYKEMYDTWSDCVYLDVTHLGSEYMKHRFPTIYNHISELNINVDKDYIPVSPVEHYCIGGITIDLNGQTSMKDLYASGECSSSGVHGANRLASNSLLECIVFGRKIAQDINGSKLSKETLTVENTSPSKHYSYQLTRQEIRDVLSKYVGIVRSEEGLLLAKNIVEKHYQNLLKHRVNSKNYYKALNISTVALNIIDSALARKESVGCHYRIN